MSIGVRSIIGIVDSAGEMLIGMIAAAADRKTRWLRTPCAYSRRRVIFNRQRGKGECAPFVFANNQVDISELLTIRCQLSHRKCGSRQPLVALKLSPEQDLRATFLRYRRLITICRQS